MKTSEQRSEELLLRAVAYVNQDKTSNLIELWHRDAKLMVPEVPLICGKEHIEAWISANMRAHRYELEIELQTIQVEARLTCADGSFIVRVIDGESGKVRVNNGKFLSILRTSESPAENSEETLLIFRWCCNSSVPPPTE